MGKKIDEGSCRGKCCRREGGVTNIRTTFNRPLDGRKDRLWGVVGQFVKEPLDSNSWMLLRRGWEIPTKIEWMGEATHGV